MILLYFNYNTYITYHLALETMKKVIVLICVSLFFASCTKDADPIVVEEVGSGETTIEATTGDTEDITDILLDDLPVSDDTSISDMIEETPEETTTQTDEESEEEVLRELENLFNDILEGE